MTPDNLASEAHISAQPTPLAAPASTFSPAQIRLEIAHWVAQDRMDVANALVDAGLALFPTSEDTLAMAALVGQVNQDWAFAQTCLERLVAVQGEAATAESHYQLVRVMRCRSALFPALRTADKASARFPDHAGLAQEAAELNALLSLHAEVREAEVPVN